MQRRPRPARIGASREAPAGIAPFRVHAARAVSVAVVATGLYYLLWRASTLSETGALGLAFYAVEALNFALLVLTVALFWRLRQRSGPVAAPSGTLDLFITVCGEPVELVEEAVQAALAVEYPHRTYLLNDGRLAGKPNWEAIERLADSYGIPCLTRTAGARGKAGNLNHALARTDGQFVAVVDCDHLASRRLGDELLGYFADERVAFVTTRQEFTGERSDVLGTREPLFFTWFQPAKDAAGAAISTGSGVVYRRAALDAVGGFSEWSIVEDFHTSTRLHAAGWGSVYHPRAVTLGVAPRTASTLVKQRLTWTTDSARVLFFDNPLLRRGLRPAQRLHHFHTGFYYLVASTQLLFLVSPALWLVWQVPIMRPSSTASYLLHSLPLVAATFTLIMLWGGRRGIRTVQQQFYLSPVFALGVARAATGVRFRSGVTEKVLESRFSPLTVPQLAIVGLLVAAIAVAFARPRDGQAAAVAWAAFMAYSLTAFATTLSGRPRVDRAVRIAVRSALVVAAAAVILPVAQWVRPAGGDSVPRWDGPLLALAPPVHGAYIGVFEPLAAQTPEGLAAWGEEHGVRPRVVHLYEEWFGNGRHGFPAEAVARVADYGAVPLVTWLPLGDAVESSSSPVRDSGTLAAIAAGDHDGYIRSWARAAAAHGRPVLLRPLHDMNGSWYPWSIGAPGHSPELFVAAWRHLHDVFAEEGAVNVGWVWSVYSFEDVGAAERLTTLFPGSGYVDWVSMSAFNWGTEGGGAWRSVDELFGPTYASLATLGKPLMISQIATANGGGDARAWVRDALRTIRLEYPLVRAVVWHDAAYSDDVDLRLRGETARAFAAEVSASPYWSAEAAIVAAASAGERHAAGR